MTFDCSIDEVYTKPVGALTSDEIKHWEDLCDSQASLASPFLSPHYALAVGRVRPGVHVSILSAGGHTVGYFPFQFASTLDRALLTAERIGGNMTDCFGIVAESGRVIEPRNLLRKAGLRAMLFSHLHPAQMQYGLASDSAEVNYLIELDGRDYWKKIREKRKKFAADTERCLRNVRREVGALKFCLQETNFPNLLAELIRLKRRQYAMAGISDALRETWTRDLLFLLAKTTKPTCSGIMSTLYAGDQWLASHFGLRSQTVLHYWFPVYNRALSRFGPGRLLLKSLIEAAPDIGIRTIDQGAGDAPSKRLICNHEEFCYRGGWYVPGLRSVVYRAWCSAIWRLTSPCNGYRRGEATEAGRPTGA